MIAAGILKRTSGSEFPAQAFYTADSGLEYGQAQYFWDGWGDIRQFVDDFDGSEACRDRSGINVGNGTYDLSIEGSSTSCPNILDPDNTDTLYLRSVGKSGGSVRRVELTF